MTNEEKQLLLKDLCARLPYGVICQLSNKDADISITEKLDIGGLEHFIYDTMDAKPYLRPMSSMTENEKENILKILFDKDSNLFYIDKNGIIEGYETTDFLAEGINVVSFCPRNIELYADWLNANHFDYRGLIEKGLALEAPTDMYIIQSLWNKNS